MRQKLNHTIVIVRVVEGARDEYGVPAQTWTDLATYSASVQEKTAREIADISQGGAVVSDYTVFLKGQPDILEADRIRLDPSDGRVWQVDGVKDPAGAHHHLELDAHLVVEPT